MKGYRRPGVWQLLIYALATRSKSGFFVTLSWAVAQWCFRLLKLRRYERTGAGSQNYPSNLDEVTGPGEMFVRAPMIQVQARSYRSYRYRS